LIDFTLTEEQKSLQERTRKFALEFIKPIAAKIDREPDPHRAFLSYKDAYEKAAELGLNFGHIPREYGGPGLSSVDSLIITEEISAADPAFPMTNALAQIPILLFGNQDQKEKWLRAPIEAIEKGQRDYICAFVLSEQRGTANFDHPGPYPAGLGLFAEYRSGEYVLNGKKYWPEAGGWDLLGADQSIFIVRTKKQSGGKEGLSAFIVPRGTKGITYNVIDKYGLRAEQTVEIVCEEAHIPEDNLIAKDKGDLVVNQSFTASGPGIGAIAVGCARAAYDYVLKWARHFTGGSERPIIQNQVVGYLLFDVASKIEASRYLCWKAAHYMDTHGYGAGSVVLGSMAKVFATESCFQAVYDCMKVMGINSVDLKHPLGKILRDASILPLFDAGNLGMQRRKAWGVLTDPNYHPTLLMENGSIEYSKEMEGWGTVFG
jgi:alkylation response protein AidB-like acyl-CoA dehydrogenase